MSTSSDQAEIGSRDDETLSFAKVGQLQLSCRVGQQERGNAVPLSIAEDHGLSCVTDAQGMCHVS